MEKNDRSKFQWNKPIHVKNILIYTLLCVFTACSKNGNNRILPHTRNVKTSIDLNDEKYNIDSLIIHCNGSKQFLAINNNSHKKGSLLESQINCMIKNIKEGNKESLKDYLNIVKNIYRINPFLNNKTNQSVMQNDINGAFDAYKVSRLILENDLKGEIIFKTLLENSNYFGCYKIYGLTCEDPSCFSVVCSHQIFFDKYISMIRSIEGISVDDYLQNNISHTLEIQLKREKDKCDELLYKEYYEVVKKAYAEGKIVLKDYGEE
jgi:hypothetical protein